MKLLKLTKWVAILAVFFSLTSCSYFFGHFCVSGMKELKSSSHFGCLSIIQGHPITNGRAGGPLENYIYLMIICPGIKAAENQELTTGVEGNPMIRPIIQHDWKTSGGDIRFSFVWNTRSDKISFDSGEFNRGKGNVFFALRTPQGKWDIQPCGALGLQADYPEAVAYIKKQLASNDVVKSVEFYGIEK